jgi:hypothetical protein
MHGPAHSSVLLELSRRHVVTCLLGVQYAYIGGGFAERIVFSLGIDPRWLPVARLLHTSLVLVRVTCVGWPSASHGFKNGSVQYSTVQ